MSTRIAVLALLVLGCGEESATPSNRGSRVLEGETEETEEEQVDESAQPTRGAARPPFEVVVQAIPAGMQRAGVRGEGVFAIQSGAYTSIIDLESGGVRATRATLPATPHELGPRARSVFFAPPADSDEDPCFWDLASDSVSCIRDDPRISSYAFAPEGATFAYLARTGEPTIAEVRTFRLGTARARRLATLPAEEGAALHYHPRGLRILVSGARGQLLDARSGRVVAEMPPPAIAQPFDPSGRMLIAFADNGIEIRNARSGAVMRRVTIVTAPKALAWGPRGEHFCFGHTLVTTASAEAREMAEECGDALDRDGAVVPRAEPAETVDPTTLVHADARGRRTTIPEYTPPHIDGVLAGEAGIELSWTVGEASARRRWIMSGAERREVAEPPWFFGQDGSRAAVDPERRVVWVQRDLARTIDLVDVPPGIDLGCHWESDATWQLVCGARPVFSGDHRHVTLGAVVFDTENGDRVGSLEGEPTAWLARGQRLVNSGSLLDLAGRRIARAPGTAAFSPDGTLLALAEQRRVQIVSAETGQGTVQFRAEEPIAWLAWNDPVSIIALGTRGAFMRFSPADGTQMFRAQIGRPRASDPQRRRLVVCDGGLANLFSTDDGIQRGPLGRCPAEGTFTVPAAGSFFAWTDGMRARIHRISDGEVLEIQPFDDGAAVASTDSGWFEPLGIPPAMLRVRTGTIQRGRLRRAERSPRMREGLVTEFLAGTAIPDPP